MLTPPLPHNEAERLLRDPADDASGPPLTALAADELADRVTATAARARELGIALGSDAAPVHGALEHAELIERLRDEFEQHVQARWTSASPVRRHANVVAGEMLHWRAAVGDGHLGRWEAEDLGTFLIAHVPSSDLLDDDARAAAPEVALALMRFLADRGSLSGDPLPDLEAACAMRGHAVTRPPAARAAPPTAGAEPSARRSARHASRAAVAERVATRHAPRGAMSHAARGAVQASASS